MQFFQNVKNFVHSTNIITHRFFHNFARSKYAIFRRMLKISHIPTTFEKILKIMLIEQTLLFKEFL